VGSGEKSGKIELNEMYVINPKSSTVGVIVNR
jgi:hypothetical protein